jgi:histone acetyltransferase 1
VEKLADCYKSVGYVTCYPFYFYPDSLRMRISQFLILPNYQSQGHGGSIYRFLCDKFRSDPTIKEICVEDPSEGFSDLRFRNDLRVLIQDQSLPTDGRPVVTVEQVESMRQRYKFGRRHATELAECFVLKYLNTRDPTKYREYRIWVKRRIYRTHEETLSAIESPQEVKDKLAGAFKNTEKDYRRLFLDL